MSKSKDILNTIEEMEKLTLYVEIYRPNDRLKLLSSSLMSSNPSSKKLAARLTKLYKKVKGAVTVEHLGGGGPGGAKMVIGYKGSSAKKILNQVLALTDKNSIVYDTSNSVVSNMLR